MFTVHAASEMTYIVSGGALNSTHSLTVHAVVLFRAVLGLKVL